MNKHRLDPLLRPKSVAVVGASKRADSIGEWALKNLKVGGFKGRIFPVNPRYDELQGHRCYSTVAALPEVPELVVFGVRRKVTRFEAGKDYKIAAIGTHALELARIEAGYLAPYAEFLPCDDTHLPLARR